MPTAATAAASPTPSPLAWTVGRMFSISTKQPMREILAGNTEYIDNLQTAQNYIEALESSVLLRIRKDNEQLAANWMTNNTDNSDDDITLKTFYPAIPCNLHDDKFRRAIRFQLELRRLPVADLSCLSVHVGPLKTINSKQIFNAIHGRGDMIYQNRFRIADAVVRNWTNTTDFPYEFDYVTETTSCRVNYAGGVRVHGKWYMLSTITSKLAAMNVPFPERQTIAEYHHILPNKSLDNSLNMAMPIRPEDGDDSPHVLENHTTTLLIAGGGSSQPSDFGRVFIDDIPALNDALDILDLSVQQANDALTPSSIAILILPLVLNLVPSVLLMPLSGSVTMLVYILITDVVTVIPLTIKGIELVVIGNHKAYSVSGRITSPVNGTLGAAAGAQIWGARCQAKKDLITVGTVFVCLACFSLVIGIALEWVSREYVLRKTELLNVQVGWDNQKHEGLLEDFNFNFYSDSLSLGKFHDSLDAFSTGSDSYGRSGSDRHRGLRNPKKRRHESSSILSGG